MRNFFLTGLFCLFALCINAQDTLRITDYKQHAELTVPDDGTIVKVMYGGSMATFAIHKTGSLLRLKNIADNQKILDMLQLDAAIINDRYSNAQQKEIADIQLCICISDEKRPDQACR